MKKGFYIRLAGEGHFKKQKIVFSVYFDMYLYDHDVLYRFLSVDK